MDCYDSNRDCIIMQTLHLRQKFRSKSETQIKSIETKSPQQKTYGAQKYAYPARSKKYIIISSCFYSIENNWSDNRGKCLNKAVTKSLATSDVRLTSNLFLKLDHYCNENEVKSEDMTF